jgi:hypothetical protein
MVVNATQASQTGGDGNQNRTKTGVKAADQPAAPILGCEALEHWNTGTLEHAAFQYLQVPTLDCPVLRASYACDPGRRLGFVS